MGQDALKAKALKAKETPQGLQFESGDPVAQWFWRGLWEVLLLKHAQPWSLLLWLNERFATAMHTFGDALAGRFGASDADTGASMCFLLL